MKQFSNKTRAIFFMATAALVTLLGLVSASWSNPVLAQGTVSVQPSATATEVSAPKTVGGPCNTTLELLDVLDQLVASAVVSPSPDSSICTLKQVVPETNDGFPVTFPEFQIKAAGLFGANSLDIPADPTGYDRISDTVQFAGAIGNNKVRMCFNLPADYASYKSVRIAYFDTTPNINRWVFLKTAVTSSTNLACMTRGLYKPIPASFALFGQN
jgi:hypothetical protein